MSPLTEALGRVKRRMSLQQWTDLTVRWLFYALAVACLWLAAARLFPVLGNPLAVSIGLLAIAAAAALVVAIRRRFGLVYAALESDRRLGLEERLTSSLELEEAEGPMIRALHTDADIHVVHLQARRDFPMRVPLEARRLLVLGLVFVGAYGFLPEFDLLGYREKVEEEDKKQKALAMKARRIRKIARKAPPIDDGLTSGTATKKIDRIAGQLERGQITEKQALARLTKLGQEIQEQKAKLKSDNPMPKMAGSTRNRTCSARTPRW